jgi:hypothetical protein
VTGLPLTSLNCSGNYMSDNSKVAGFTGTWDGNFIFGVQYKGTPLNFVFDKNFIIPPTAGAVNIDVSTGVSGGNGSYTYDMFIGPAGLDIDQATGIISGTLIAGESGVMMVTVNSLDDNDISISKTIWIPYGVPISSDDGGNDGGDDGSGDDGNDRPGNGESNMLLYVAVIAVVAIAAFVAYWFVLRPKT